MGSREEFVDFIKDELAKRNWSHAELARRSGISQAHISRVLNNDFQPGLDFIGSLAKAFKLPVELLLIIIGIIPNKQPPNSSIEEINQIIAQLNIKDQEFILGFIHLFSDYRKNNDKGLD